MSALELGHRAIERVVGRAGAADSLRWVDSTPAGAANPFTRIGEPGLWRPTCIEDRIVSGFACPSPARLARFGGGEARVRDSARLEAEVEAWARASLRGALPRAWRAPGADEAASWVGAEKLAVRSGAHAVQGVLECSAERLRVRFPEVVCISDGLSKARLEWLRALCLDTQLRWQLARFGIVGDRVCAEIDLSGAPDDLVEPLLRVAALALVVSVGWVLPALALIVDPSARSMALDRGPWWVLAEEAAAG